ncbi:hypothetical protein DCM91_13885 [Chitinophaga costaii]|nr:hypothetical protein [Chitinophaga costaii]PUZ23877.1 hypothetical protein DCM91_13885 [Chitinophaga costaii]
MKQLIFIFAGLVGVLSSCSKEYVDKYHLIAGDTVNVSGYTNIQSFKITEFSPDTALLATISHDSIIVYWPSYKTLPDSIRPEIILPAKATIAPVSGKAIAFQSGEVYTVTSEAGIQQQYKLYIDLRQPKPSFSLVAGSQLWTGPENVLNGDWFLADTARTSITFVAVSDKKEYQALLLNMNSTSIHYALLSNVPAGTYDVKVTNGIYTIYNSESNARNAIEVVNEPYPWLYKLGSPFLLKPGGTFTVKGTYLSGTIGASIITNLDTFEELPVKVVRVISDDQVELQLPADIAPGTYPGLALYTTTDGINGPTGFSELVIQVTP